MAHLRTERGGGGCQRRWLPRSLALGLLALLVAQPAGAARVSLTVMGAYPKGSPAGDILDRYIQQYQQLHPEIEIVQVPRTGTDQEAMEKIYTSIAAGVAPDIVFIPQVFLTDYVRRRVVTPVPSTLTRRIETAYLPGALYLAKYQNILYGFPTESMSQALVYNATVFSQAGFADQAPSTWDELRDWARKLTVRGPDGRLQRAGYGILTYATPIAAYVLSYSWSYGGNPISPDLRRVQFSAPEPVAAVRFLRQLYLEDQTAVLGTTGFTQHQLAMFFAHGPWQASGFRKVGQDFYNGLRSALPPKGSTGKPEATFYGYLWAVTPYTKHPQESYEFLFWLCTEVTERGTTRMGDVLEALGSIPNTAADARNQPSMKEPFMAGFLQAVVTGAARPIPAIPAWLDSFGELGRQVEAVLRGQLPPEQAMGRVDQVIQQKIDEYFGR